MTKVNLPEFLLARPAETEQTAREWQRWGRLQVVCARTGASTPDDTVVATGLPGGPWFADGRELHNATMVRVLWDPAHVLAECSAKRQIIEHVLFNRVQSDGQILKTLARPYVDHPDYQWKWQR